MSRDRDDDSAASSAAIRADIASTRARMGETLEELGTRLNPDRLKQQAKDTVREATIGRVETMARETVDKATTAGKSVAGVVRDNPIPAAMIVAGIGWLVWRGRNSQVQLQTAHEPTIRSGAAPSWYDDSAETTEPSGITDQVKDKASAVADAASDITHRASDVASDLTHRAADGARQATEKTKQLASNVASNVSMTVRQQSQRVSTTYDANPLAVGAVVLAAGLAVGLSVPSTKKEGELFGSMRDDFVDKAKEVASEKADEIHQVAERVVDEVSAKESPVSLQENRASF